MRNKWKSNQTSGSLHRLGLAALCLVWLMACAKKETVHDEYTCPMHPTVLADKPGTCPVCGMDLVRKARPGEVSAADGDLTPLLKSTNEVVASDVKTIKGEYRTVPLSQETQGIITYDTRNSYTLSVRTGGRLEKVFLKYAFQPVNKGQKVAELYSPELITAQEADSPENGGHYFSDLQSVQWIRCDRRAADAPDVTSKAKQPRDEHER